jgi:hypothetical protein
VKLIISSVEGVKRQIDGPFSICGSLSDLTTLRNELNRAIEIDRPFSYGWVEIIPLRPAHKSCSALAWEDQA